MIPTFQSGDTIERTLTSVLAQEYRPLEVLVYDECSQDSTRAIVERLLASADPEIEARLVTSEHNSGPVRAWRVALHAITGDWCSFVWADDVLMPSYSTQMMAAAARARDARRKLVTCSAEVEADGTVGSVLRHRRRCRDAGRVLGGDLLPEVSDLADLLRIRDERRA